MKCATQDHLDVPYRLLLDRCTSTHTSNVLMLWTVSAYVFNEIRYCLSQYFLLLFFMVVVF